MHAAEALPRLHLFLKQKQRIMLRIAAFLLIFQGLALGQTIQHLEPSNWWLGMKDPNFQVLVHAENIANYTPAINFKGIRLKAVHKTENPNYLFLDFEIKKNAKAGNMTIEFSKGSDKISTNYPILNRKKNSATREGFNTSDAVYLITPDRFSNGKPENDNIEGYADKAQNVEYGRHGGDIQGIINHLDYIQQMGFTAIWPMPMEENNMDQWSYHGYAITDFYKIDPRFGSNEEYIALSKKASEKGIKLIRDVVLNHCGSNHWWMNDLPSKDWINFGGKYVNTNHRREVHRDIHASNADKDLYLDGWFVETMPDMNQRNPFLANYLIQNSLWWIETADLGGLRVDTYPYSDPAFLTHWSQRIMEEYPNFNITSEEWSTNPAITSYWQMGKVNSNGYKSYVPSPMDFPLQNAVIKGLSTPENWNGGLITIYESLTNDFLYADAAKLLIFPDNHDMSRVFTQLKENLEQFKMAITLFSTMRGIPQFYYGTEVLMSNPHSESHGEIRGDFPGGFEGMTSNAKSGEGLSAKEKDAQNFMKTLLNYRKTSEALHNGELTHFAPENGIYVYFRHSLNEKVMVIINKNDKPMNLNLERFRELLPAQSSARNIITNQKVSLGKSLSLTPLEPVVLEIN